jgi:RNA polymerase sigma factor (sigma-70 family)
MRDSELWTALETYHSESFGWALSCCVGSSVEADAVLQAVYLKVLAGQARYDGKASFKTWLFAVIRRTAADERRRQMLRRILLERRPMLAPAPAVERPDEALYKVELQQLVREVLNQLPRRQREVLQLIFYHELSLAEAAEVMGVSPGSAHTHYDRAKRKMRAYMKELQIHEEARRNNSQRTISATETGR